MTPNANTGRVATGAAALLLFCVAGLLSLLALPLTAAVGPFYWDIILYYDATARIARGQIPIVDFLTPVGPLGYWLFAALHAVFPEGQGVYMATWSIFLITGPLVAFLVLDVARRSLPLAVALALPLFVFSALPFNVEQFDPYPGVDGYGIYNRHISQLLYVLVAALLFMERKGLAASVVAIALAALFLTKITGFLVALPFLALAILSGRLTLPHLGAVVAFMTVVLGGLEIWSGLTRAYVVSIIDLIALNEGSLPKHLVHGAARHLGAVMALAGFTLVAIWAGRERLSAAFRRLLEGRGASALAAVCGMGWAWSAMALAGGTLLESQNWGGQAFLFIWPPALACLGEDMRTNARLRMAGIILLSAALMPGYFGAAARAARTFVAQIQYTPIDAPALGPIGAVSKRGGIDRRVEMIREIAIAHPGAQEAYAAANELPFFTYYAQPEFQLAWLNAIGEGVTAIRAHEAAESVRFETILSLNFVNPFPYLLDRGAPRLITVGKDPFRSLPPPDSETLAEIAATDLILWPKCPVTAANQAIRTIYRDGLRGRQEIALSPCWDGYVKTDPSRLGEER